MCWLCSLLGLRHRDAVKPYRRKRPRAVNEPRSVRVSGYDRKRRRR